MNQYGIIGALGMFCLLLLTIFSVRTAGPDGPFGKVSKIIREQRILRIGMGLGLILGVGYPRDVWGAAMFTLGIFILTVTTVAQITWPNKTPDGEETLS